MYDNGHMMVCMGGFYADSFKMHSGNRQGCPLSPLLFDVLVNTTFWQSLCQRYCHTRCIHCTVSRIKTSTCPGGHMQMTLSGWNPTFADAKTFCTASTTGSKMGDGTRTSECRVLCISSNGSKLAHANARYSTPAGDLPVVTEYKYLGIMLDEIQHYHEVLDHMRG